MRELKIQEVDNECYVVELSDFKDNVHYHWDLTTRKFYAEYQTATLKRRRFERVYLDFAKFPTLGDAINEIMRIEREQREAHYRALVAG